MEPPLWPGTIVTICTSHFTAGGPSSEHQTNRTTNPKSLGKVKGRHHVSDHFPGSSSLASILAKQCVHHQEGPWVRMIGQRQPQNESHLYKSQDCEPWGKAVLLVSHSLLFSTCVPFPIKSLAMSACMALPAIHFKVLDKSPLSDPERDPPSYNSSSSIYWGFELCKKLKNIVLYIS